MEKNNFEDFKKELKNVWFWLYISSIIAIVIVFNVYNVNEFLNIGSLFLLSIIQILYGAFQVKASYNETIFQKFIGLGYGIFLLVFALINLAVKVNETMIALTILFSFFGIVMIIITKFLFNLLWNVDKNSKHALGKIIFFYLLFALSLNYMFAFGYTIISVPENSHIVTNEGSQISGALDYVLFSYSIFYTSVTEYIPQGYSKLFSILHVTISFILHVIILGGTIKKGIIGGQDKNSADAV